MNKDCGIKKRIRSLAAAALCALLVLCAPSGAFALSLQEYASQTPAGDSPYLITVNTRENVVTVYGMGEDGRYSVPVRSMICSAGKSSSATPLGTFSIYGERYEWRRMVDGSYGQYAVRFNGSILFHSVCYYAADPSRLMSYEYDALGSNASLGCVRLQVADAKWIYDNCPAGTIVRVSAEDGEGPLGKPDRLVDSVSGSANEGWDPTDPREDNPWRSVLPEGAGGSSGAVLPSGAVGVFKDVRPDDWFYESVLWCAERSVLKGTGAGFEPYAGVSRAMLWQMIYQLAGEPGSALEYPQGSGEGAWYGAARSWCLENGIAGASAALDPEAPASRQEFVTALFRYHRAFRDANPGDPADLSVFADAGGLGSEAADAFGWAAAAGIITGDTDSGGERTLRPSDGLIRAELAAIMQRYGKAAGR